MGAKDGVHHPNKKVQEDAAVNSLTDRSKLTWNVESIQDNISAFKIDVILKMPVSRVAKEDQLVLPWDRNGICIS